MIQNEVFDLDVTLDGTWDTTNKVITSLTEETSIVIHDSWGSEESYELFASNFTLQNKQIQ
ncbi:MAG: hypothetical protein H6767_06055 [Candidatus Peribacteria bacterium]|nr:MAG: hypothetical protein H6767_06055 [Candidatus Peribacteria bacterium]